MLVSFIVKAKTWNLNKISINLIIIEERFDYGTKIGESTVCDNIVHK